jgi:hypothetical protein
MQMNRATKLALAVAPSIAALATASQSASAGSPPFVPPSPRPGVVIPDDFVVLTDATGTITIGVPDWWTDVDTEPAGDTPWISATTDFLGFIGSFDVPGVIFEALPFTADTASLARELGYADDCVKQLVQPYDDGAFAGSHLIDTGCGQDRTAQYHVVVVNPVDERFTALLEIQLSAPDEAPILDGLLGTFDLAAAPLNVAVPATRCEPPRVVLLPAVEARAPRPRCPVYVDEE